jgi:hypothetical protein
VISQKKKRKKRKKEKENVARACVSKSKACRVNANSPAQYSEGEPAMRSTFGILDTANGTLITD